MVMSTVVQAQDVLDRDRIRFDRLVETQASVEAEYYEFTDDEKERLNYLRVIDAPFSVENISGLELLGKYAETTDERDEYARRFVAAHSDNVVRSNVWALTVARVARETDLTLDATENSPALVRELAEHGFTLTKGDVGKSLFNDRKERRAASMLDKLGRSSRVVNYFVSFECGDDCSERFKKLHSENVSGVIGELNIIFIGTTDSDSDKVFDWAREHSITKAELLQGSINLHVDNEYWTGVRAGDDVPQIH